MMWTLRLRKSKQLAQSHTVGKKKGWYFKPNLKFTFLPGYDSDDCNKTLTSEQGIRYSSLLVALGLCQGDH